MGFQRKKEDFTCEHCKKEILGTGYTNHCHHCLWSKHVDITPGDRLNECKGMMRPVRLEGSTDALKIIHLCELCSEEKRNSVQDGDASDVLIALSKRA